MRKLLLTTLLIVLSLSYFSKAHDEVLAMDNDEDHDGIDHGTDEGMEFSANPETNDAENVVKLDEVIAKFLYDDSKMWKKGPAQAVFLEFYAHMTVEEYKVSVEHFYKTHAQGTHGDHHPTHGDLMNAHQIRHFCDHIFGAAEEVTNDSMKANLDMDVYLEWLDTLSEEEHQAYEDFKPSHDTLYHEEMDFDM